MTAEQLNILSVPLARRTDPATSHLAAATLDDKARQRRLVLAVLRTYGPMTDEALVNHLSTISPSGARTRRSELVRAGLVQDTGDRLPTSSGRKAIVWQAA